MTKIVLVDMDGVLASYCDGWSIVWQERYPDWFCPDLSMLKTFYIEDSLPDQLKPYAITIDKEEGFFLNLPEIPGAIEAMKELRSIPDITVKICTAPVRSHFCMAEKYMWVEKHLGYHWLADLIMTKDKTIVRGDYLIDDKPLITGLIKSPSWEQVIYRQSYNLEKPGRWITWDNYEWLVEELKRK